MVHPDPVGKLKKRCDRQVELSLPQPGGFRRARVLRYQRQPDTPTLARKLHALRTLAYVDSNCPRVSVPHKHRAGNRGSLITWLFVHPSFRRRGVGTALVKDLLRKLDQPVTLNVALTNGPALSLYQHMGFKVEREFVGDFNGRPCKVARLHYVAVA